MSDLVDPANNDRSSFADRKREYIENFKADEALALGILDSVDNALVVSLEDRLLYKSVFDKKMCTRSSERGSCRQETMMTPVQSDLPSSQIYKVLAKLKLNKPTIHQSPAGGEQSEELLRRLHTKIQRMSRPARKTPAETIAKRRKRVDTAEAKEGRPTLTKAPHSEVTRKQKIDRQQASNSAFDDSTQICNKVKKKEHSKACNFKYAQLTFASSRIAPSLDNAKRRGLTKAKIKSAFARAQSEQSNTDKSKWSVAMQKASGQKLVPSKKLGKLIKSKEVKKKRSGKAWAKRQQEADKRRKVAAEKRNANLSKRTEAKCEKKKKKLAKKGHLI